MHREKESEWERSSCPNGCDGQGWARPKSGGWNSIQASLVGGRDPRTLGLLSAAFPGTFSRELDCQVEQLGFKPATIWDTSITGGRLTLWTTATTLLFYSILLNKQNSINCKQKSQQIRVSGALWEVPSHIISWPGLCLNSSFSLPTQGQRGSAQRTETRNSPEMKPTCLYAGPGEEVHPHCTLASPLPRLIISLLRNMHTCFVPFSFYHFLISGTATLLSQISEWQPFVFFSTTPGCPVIAEDRKQQPGGRLAWYWPRLQGCVLFSVEDADRWWRKNTSPLCQNTNWRWFPPPLPCCHCSLPGVDGSDNHRLALLQNTHRHPPTSNTLGASRKDVSAFYI